MKKSRFSQNKIILFLILGVILGNFGLRVYSYREEYLKPFDAYYWKQRYLRSQWVDPLSEESIGDDGLYTYVGWEYVQGRDPTTLNAQMPPLGKYLIGISEIVFNNQNIFALFSGFAVLIVLFKFSSLVFPKPIWAFLPVLGFSLEPLFFTQLRAPFLDNLYLFFLLLTFYFFLNAKGRFLNFCLSSLFLGLFTATKSPFLSIFVLISMMLMLIFEGRKEFTKWLLSLSLSLFSYLLTYFRFFQLGGSLRGFLGVQKWLLSFYLSSGPKIKVGMVWPMIFVNRWQTWWAEEMLRISSWNFSWPILSLATFVVLVIVFKRGKKVLKLNPGILLSLIWVFVYLLFLTFIPVWPRYFLLFLPFEYLLFTWIIAWRLSKSFGRKFS